MSISSDPQTNNLILKSLPREDAARLAASSELIVLKHGDVLYEVGNPVDYIYFPTSAMVSVVTSTLEGQTAEVGVIGSEGLTGVESLLNSKTTSVNTQIIQLPGELIRVRHRTIRDEFHRGGSFQKSALEFTRALMVQISQTALCNRLHTADRRLAKWLLLCHDRNGGGVLNITQEFAAVMLGSNRTSVTLAAGDLQDKGFIEYSRGRITLRDRNGLEEFACECYARIQSEYASLLSRK